jgi:hypothetical protein
MKRFGLILLALTATGLAQNTPRPNVGTNLSSVNYFATQLPFVDVFKTAKAWHSATSSTWDDGRTIATDTNGNVTKLEAGQFARTLVLREIGGHYPIGEYTLTFQGEGQLEIGFAAKVLERKGNAIRLDVKKSSDGILIDIRTTNPQNPIRDLRLTMPGGICQGNIFKRQMSATECVGKPFLEFNQHSEIIFNPDFLEKTKAYSALRFMDWAETNNSTLVSSTKRPKVSDATWGVHGVPLEIMIELGNTLNQDIWLNIPHQANDALILEMAQMVKTQLKPNLQVFIEHSNEIWNGQFRQYRYAVEQGKTLVNNEFESALLYHAEKTRAIGAIWKKELGQQAKVVFAGQAANSWTLERSLEYLQNKYGNHGLDAIAIAPYMTVVPNATQAASFESLSLEQLFSKVKLEVLPESICWMKNNALVAKKFNLTMLAYEGGQHLVGTRGAENNPKLNTLFDAFNRDPRIKPLYLEYLNAWKNSGGQAFMHFTDIGTYSKWGRWGALENLNQPRAEAPKFDAIMTFLEK